MKIVENVPSLRKVIAFTATFFPRNKKIHETKRDDDKTAMNDEKLLSRLTERDFEVESKLEKAGRRFLLHEINQTTKDLTVSFSFE